MQQACSTKIPKSNECRGKILSAGLWPAYIYIIGEVGFKREQQAEENLGVFARFSLRILTICHFGWRTLPHQAPTTVNQADAGRLGNQSLKYHTTFSDTIPFWLGIKEVVITTEIPVIDHHCPRQKRSVERAPREQKIPQRNDLVT